MVGLIPNLPLACDGCFVGYPAVLSLVVIVLALIGSIYVLLWSNFGARVGYLITMTSLFAFLFTLSLLWMIGAPGTTTATGPRGREPAWVPFKPDSAQAAQFRDLVDRFPQGWDAPGIVYPGKIDSNGEIESLRATLEAALANDATVNGLDATSPSDWAFRVPGTEPVSEADAAIPEAKALAFTKGSRLLFGVTIPATDTHREVTVFAYRDKGLVFLYALYFILVSLVGFIVHLWLLARVERRQKERDAQMAATSA